MFVISQTFVLLSAFFLFLFRITLFLRIVIHVHLFLSLLSLLCFRLLRNALQEMLERIGLGVSHGSDYE
jgi:hypothetical protein